MSFHSFGTCPNPPNTDANTYLVENHNFCVSSASFLWFIEVCFILSLNNHVAHIFICLIKPINNKNNYNATNFIPLL